MTDRDELEIYRSVNKCQTLAELAEAIEDAADDYGDIQGTVGTFKAKEMADHCLHYESRPKSSLTRNYGIRQQAMMIIFHMI